MLDQFSNAEERNSNRGSTTARQVARKGGRNSSATTIPPVSYHPPVDKNRAWNTRILVEMEKYLNVRYNSKYSQNAPLDGGVLLSGRITSPLSWNITQGGIGTDGTVKRMEFSPLAFPRSKHNCDVNAGGNSTRFFERNASPWPGYCRMCFVSLISNPFFHISFSLLISDRNWCIIIFLPHFVFFDFLFICNNVTEKAWIISTTLSISFLSWNRKEDWRLNILVMVEKEVIISMRINLDEFAETRRKMLWFESLINRFNSIFRDYLEN